MIETEIDSIFSSQPVPSQKAVESMRKKYGNDTMDRIWFGNDIQEDLMNARLKQRQQENIFYSKLKHLISLPKR